MIDATLYSRYANDPAAFRDDLLIDVDGVARRFGDVMDPWQRADFAAIDPALMRSNGRADTATSMRAYWERPRGHSKTTDLAALCLWFLIFAKRLVRGYFFAGDKDQAELPKQQMETFIRLNPWIGKIIEVQKRQVVNIASGHPGAGSSIEIYSSDVGSSYGLLPDFLLAEELTHWEGDGSLWHSIVSSAAKRKNCLLMAIANAGFADSWQWAVREVSRLDDAWIFSRLDGPQASWLTPERLEEQRRMLPAIAFARLWQNQWSSGGGDALSPSTIDAAFSSELQPMAGRQRGWIYCAGVDLGLVRDCAAVIVLAVPEGGRAGRVRLAHNRLWRPTPGQKINLLDVEKHLLDLDKQFGLEFIGFDPWQMEHLAQTLEADSSRYRRNQRRIYNTQPWMRELPPTPSNLREQATLTIECFNDRRVQCYECEPLHRDLHKLRVVEKSYGVRLESPRDAEGHGDTFSAFALALMLAHELAGKARITIRPLFGNGVDHYTVDGWQQRVEEHRREQEEALRSLHEDVSSRITFSNFT